jgi:hypothetical protein
VSGSWNDNAASSKAGTTGKASIPVIYDRTGVAPPVFARFIRVHLRPNMLSYYPMRRAKPVLAADERR